MAHLGEYEGLHEGRNSIINSNDQTTSLLQPSSENKLINNPVKRRTNIDSILTGTNLESDNQDLRHDR